MKAKDKGNTPIFIGRFALDNLLPNYQITQLPIFLRSHTAMEYNGNKILVNISTTT
jgi:hypothetical protein